MSDYSTVPYTIIKEKSGDAVDYQNNQWKWTKFLFSSPEKISYYLVKDITLEQEPTEMLTMSVTFTKLESKCQFKSDKNCESCERKITSQNSTRCSYCHSSFFKPACNCSLEKRGITYDLRIDFDNYLHEFCCNYSYEVVCWIPRVNKPDEYLFLCVEPRIEKSIVFKKCNALTAYDDDFNLSNLNLYFGIRRLNNNQNSGTSTLTMVSIASALQNTDGNGCKVILQAKDGQITVHKSILSQYSDVFRAMFAHEMKETQHGVVEISDVETKVIKKMVDYLYTGKLENITGMAQDLFKLAHRYQIHELCRRCEEFYIFNVNIDNDNIVEILELIDLYELEELKNSAEKFVTRFEQNLSKLPSYQNYLCQSLCFDKAVHTLILADKYKMKDVKSTALDFIKLNYSEMINNNDFLTLFESNSRLMKEIYVFSFKETV